METKRYELETIYDDRKSFYGKAIVVDEGVFRYLYSYGTLVAKINTDRLCAIVRDTYSKTTLRHIKEFLKQNGFRAVTKKQIEEDYVVGYIW